MNDKTQQALVMLVKRLSSSLRTARPESKLPDTAMRYLSDNGLISVCDCLRDQHLYRKDEQLTEKDLNHD